MENEDLNLNLEELDQIEASADNKLKVKNRFQTLSDKVKSEAQEREKAQAQLKTEADARLNAEKERDFYKSFSTISSKHPEAAQFQEQILERVNKGYDPEEAALAVLAKEGKLQNFQPAPRQVQAEGGSALNQLSEGNKEMQEMTLDEKRSALQDLEQKGELAAALRSMRG